jgi:type II secretory ATPase GspE/PulE/Tfp pilus assembly ATPase PilB-like protein
VDEKAGLSFANALRSILRQDPDIIMVGEIRDGETAEMAIRSAMTGHLVFSTVHANDAPSTATRIVDMGIQPFLAASALNLVIAQRLVRRNCELCVESYVPTEEQLGALQMAQERRPGATFKRGRGCTLCRGRGFLGRVAIYELLNLDQFVRQLIMDKRPAKEIADLAVQSGMITLRESGIRKVEQGVTTPEEVLKVVFAEDV